MTSTVFGIQSIGGIFTVFIGTFDQSDPVFVGRFVRHAWQIGEK